MSKLTIHSDGASKGNPGDAGIGVVITDESGAVVKEVAAYIGKTTNNVAEYSALIRGLREAADLEATSIVIATDSELLARQLAGVYKVKSPLLRPLYEEAMGLLRVFPKVSITHVMREFNKRADELANLGVKNRNSRVEVVREEPAVAESPAQPSQGELQF